MRPGYRLHGLSLSYFTGKLEAYMRAKGLAYEFVEMDMRDFRACARATGIAQMPQLECADGSWLTDTTAIIRHFEGKEAGPALSPENADTRFLSLLLEDFGDEWLWRPALYYRWAFDDDMRLMSAQLARGMLRDLPVPFALRRQFILRRQRRVYLREDGITPSTAPLVERLYHEVLDAMDAALRDRPYLFGERPVEADFGFFGSMFRHFFSDPTPAAIMRARAPHVLAWVARLWAADPPSLAGTQLPDSVPDDLAPLLVLCAGDYLPYLAANAEAFAQGHKAVCYQQGGKTWHVPVNPYRAGCLAALQRAFQALDAPARAAISRRLGDGADHLSAPAAAEPPAPGIGTRPLDRQLRG